MKSYSSPSWFPRVAKGLLLFIVLAVVFIWIYEVRPTATPAAAERAPIPRRPTPAWREIGHWTGKGHKATEHFYVSSSPWRIVWKAEDSTDFQGNFAIWIYQPEDDVPSKLVANTVGTASDVSHLYLSPGTYYLDIQGTLNAWTVGVEVKE